MFGRNKALAVVSCQDHTADIYARVNAFDEVRIFKSSSWCPTELRWTCTLTMGDRQSGEIKFTADAATMNAAIAAALAKADNARRRLR